MADEQTEFIPEGFFKCDHCKGVFKKAWSDEESNAESLALWGELKPEDRAVLCDPCHMEFMKWAAAADIDLRKLLP